MILQDEMTNRKIRVLLDYRDSQPVSITLFKYWCACLYPLQNMTLYGIIFPKLPHLKLSNADTRNIWTLTELLFRVGSLWKIVCESDIRT